MDKPSWSATFGIGAMVLIWLVVLALVIDKFV